MASGVVIACRVDVSRLLGYGTGVFKRVWEGDPVLVFAAVLFAFLGVFLGNRVLKKITIRFVQTLVAVMLFLIAGGLAAGLI